MHTVPPFGAVHESASFLIAHVVLLRAVVRWHVTAPGLPHVDFAAHAFTAPWHVFLSSPAATAAFTVAVAHWT